MTLPTEGVRLLAEEVLRPERFVTCGVSLLATRGEASLPWEIFQGRLLDEAHTRQVKTFETWNLHLVEDGQPSPVPVLSLLLDGEAGELHVVRGIENFVWEGYDAGGGTFLSRERRRWQRELIATVDLAGDGDLRGEVTEAVHRAVVGTRLPLTPVEAPLPAFSFGRLYYPPGEGTARELEFLLRSRPSLTAADLQPHWPRAAEFFPALRRLFLDVSLSPWTGLVSRVLDLLRALERDGFASPAEVLDFESWLLRLVCRHLTAYDLVLYHHRGANYPDALLLDAVLADLLERLERPDAEPPGRLLRRAVRQAYCLRRTYEGHAVPDVPTSPGEHVRVFPAGHPRVPEEQLTQPGRRRRRLFAGDPLLARLTGRARGILAASVEDLADPAEWQELGAAVYLDRPFGAGKGPVSPDGTPLLASLAFSESTARQRLRLLGRDLELPAGLLDATQASPAGLPLAKIGPPVRQGTVSLTDAARAAPDFVFRYTLPGSVRSLFGLFDLGPLEEVPDLAALLGGRVLLARACGSAGTVIYDESLQARAEIEPVLDAGYATRGGVEAPAGGLRVRHPGGEVVLALRP